MIDETFFREAYERDFQNRQLQQWDGKDGYWEQVQYFYRNGKWGGWNEIERQLLKMYIGLPTDAFADVQQRLMLLGKRIGAEWAKHDEVRAINSDDLGRFLQKLNDAVVLEATIADIETFLDKKVIVCRQNSCP